MSESAFRPNTEGLQQLGLEVRVAGERALADVWKTLRRWGQEYKRRVQRVVPVRYGTLRQSFQVIEQNDGRTMAVTLGTSLKSPDGRPYPLYLEYGTEHIAGGRVKDWQPGDAPIMEWPAKMTNLPNFRLSGDRRNRAGKIVERSGGQAGTEKFERAVSITTRAFTGGQGTQMPFLRPVGHAIAPRVIEDCQVAIRDGFAAVMAGKRF